VTTVNTATILLHLEAAKPVVMPPPNPARIVTQDHVDKVTRHNGRDLTYRRSPGATRFSSRRSIAHCEFVH